MYTYMYLARYYLVLAMARNVHNTLLMLILSMSSTCTLLSNYVCTVTDDSLYVVTVVYTQSLKHFTVQTTSMYR